ncbi:hypothetical protein CHUAL_003063 [Chamberlinius hualienensis]
MVIKGRVRRSLHKSQRCSFAEIADAAVMDNEDGGEMVDEVFEDWNQPGVSSTVQPESSNEHVVEEKNPVGLTDLFKNKCLDDNLQQFSQSSDDKNLPKVSIQCESTSEENRYYEWPNSSIKWNQFSSGDGLSKPSVLEVPSSLNLQGKSNLLENTNYKFFLNAYQVVDQNALSVPSSPDSFYSDSPCSSCGGPSGDLCSPTSSPLSSRSLSCEILDQASVSINHARRSNSSDSAVIMVPEEEQILSPNQDRCYFQKLEIKPSLSLDEAEKTLAALKLDSTSRDVLGLSDHIPSPFLSMPSVVISDHSDFYRSFDEYSSFNDSLCADSHIQHWHQFRKLSDCSSTTGSITSNPSIDEEEAEDQYRVLDEDKCLLPSGWKKVRNVVHWSPFVQTYKKQKYPWVQLAGHKGSFKPGDHGTILKKLCQKEEKCLIRLTKDELSPFVPEYKGRVVGNDDEMYLQLQDLLKDFEDPCVMDCKIGVRTYLEEELSKAKEKAKLRKDMYEKMIQVDPTAATEEEHRLKGVTKPRYMVWRETISSTATLGFRIDGMKRSNGLTSKDFKMTKTVDQVTQSFRLFLEDCEHVVPQYIERLKELQVSLGRSKFFKTHELIGSSLLFVHDKVKASIWMIDFAKTLPLPDGIHIDHKSPWDVGNHEDGYLIGMDNLINIFSSL